MNAFKTQIKQLKPLPRMIKLALLPPKQVMTSQNKWTVSSFN
jgi:hypothetical protein